VRTNLRTSDIHAASAYYYKHYQASSGTLASSEDHAVQVRFRWRALRCVVPRAGRSSCHQRHRRAQECSQGGDRRHGVQGGGPERHGGGPQLWGRGRRRAVVGDRARALADVEGLAQERARANRAQAAALPRVPLLRAALLRDGPWLRAVSPAERVGVGRRGHPQPAGASVSGGHHSSQRVAMHGFDLKDAVHLVATLEQLIWDSEATLLEQVYHRQARPVHDQITRAGLSKILQEYMMKWILGEQITPAVTPGLLNNPKILEGAFPRWPAIVAFLEGQVRALDFTRQRTPTRGGAGGLAQRYSFHDAHEIVGGITQNFASFWESECTEMKDQLIAMDVHGTGRVPLSRFYGTGLDADWRFAESESYLRDLGALDETSTWQGKQVIIPNYIQAASNCIVSAPHYLVCCANTCEALLGELETGVGEPVGTAEAILRLVGNMTSQASLDDDEAPRLQGSLAAQLEQIASAHGGQVPLHGRLFAQWLHYAFPRDCPFPHRAGAAAARTPAQFGQGYLATRDEMASHARAENASEVSQMSSAIRRRNCRGCRSGARIGGSDIGTTASTCARRGRAPQRPRWQGPRCSSRRACTAPWAWRLRPNQAVCFPATRRHISSESIVVSLSAELSPGLTAYPVGMAATQHRGASAIYHMPLSRAPLTPWRLSDRARTHLSRGPFSTRTCSAGPSALLGHRARSLAGALATPR
ncbi:unnamed protein product, partial [Prorocentrum cordatum]